MKQITLNAGECLTSELLSRQGVLPRAIEDQVAIIIEEVRAYKDAALIRYAKEFDGVEQSSFFVDPSMVKAAKDKVDPAFLEALKKAYQQIYEFHLHEKETSWFTTRKDGTMLGVKITPLESCAVYVPGGRAQYPSTVLMDVIPAKVAGVERVIMVTPPQKDGELSPYTLAAADLAGVDEIYAVGGAQAIAACAYGTESIPKVQKIVGPGNAYVAAAKRAVSGEVGIDMVAGPSEVCILADDTADPCVVAADLMAQAEHDPLAACYLVTDSPELPPRVAQALALLVPQSPRAAITQQSLDNQGLCVVTQNLADAVAAVNVIAPEHLELHCKDAMELLGGIKNAGAIFVGAWSSEPLGDYVAGPNHTLPTGGSAAFSNPLGVYDFCKRSSVICYSAAGFERDASAVQTLAQAEGLWAHALSVGMRKKLLATGGEHFESLSFACSDAMSTAWPQKLSSVSQTMQEGR